MGAADLSCQHWILLKLELIKTNEAIMQMWGCRDIPCYVRFTFSGPLTDSLMLCTLWISKVAHLPVSVNDAALPTFCFCSFSADAFYFISVAFVIIASAIKRAEYFYTHKQKKKDEKKHVFSLKISTSSSLAGLIKGTAETTATSREAGYCYKLFAQSTMYSFNSRFRWLITLAWMQTHWMIMLAMDREYAGIQCITRAYGVRFPLTLIWGCLPPLHN